MCPILQNVHILVTNDDGIDSLGLHHLAVAMLPFGAVTVVAPDSEYSGAGTSLGALHEIRPEVHRVTLTGIDGLDQLNGAFTVSGPPSLCVFFARLGVFGFVPDLIVSGINPGANVGRVVYHSGTVGAALTARNGNISGVAISQDVPNGSVDGQGLEALLAAQRWEVAAEIATEVVAGLLASKPTEAKVINVNVPNLPRKEIRGWRASSLGTTPPRSVTRAELEPKPGHSDAYRVVMSYGDLAELDANDDGGAVTAGYVSVVALTRLAADVLDPVLIEHLDALYPKS